MRIFLLPLLLFCMILNSDIDAQKIEQIGESFNAKFETDFDPTIGKTNIVPQEIGRVILNLINNAFYAVSEKANLLANGHQPLVVVSTKKMQNKVEVKVKDNGGGIVKKIWRKYFSLSLLQNQRARELDCDYL